MGIGCIEYLGSKNITLREKITSCESLVIDPNSLVRLERSQTDASYMD